MKIKVTAWIYPLLCSGALLIMISSCERSGDPEIDPCPDIPLNFSFDHAVYHYGGGMFTHCGVTFTWDSVKNATGYNVYRKSANGYVLEKTTTYTRATVAQGRTTIYWSVTAFNDECESNFSEEEKVTILK